MCTLAAIQGLLEELNNQPANKIEDQGTQSDVEAVIDMKICMVNRGGAYERCDPSNYALGLGRGKRLMAVLRNEGEVSLQGEGRFAMWTYDGVAISQ